VERKLNSKLEMLLDRFEKEVEPYDRLSSILALLTPVGVIFSILIPIPFIPHTSQTIFFCHDFRWDTNMDSRHDLCCHWLNQDRNLADRSQETCDIENKI